MDAQESPKDGPQMFNKDSKKITEMVPQKIPQEVP